MPYIYKKKKVDMPGAPYDYDLVKSYTEIANVVLELERQIVGVKLVYNKEEFDNWEVPEPNKKYSYCQMIRDASAGKIQKSKLEHHMCDGGTTALGLERSTEIIENGTEYFSYDLYSTPATAKRIRNNIKSLHAELGLTYGVITGPVTEFKNTPPDVVMIIDTPYVAMRLTQGYVYHTGIKPEVDYGAMQAICSELTVVPYLTGSMNISTLCPSTRMLSSWKEEELGISIPYEKYIETIEGVVATSKATDSAPKRRGIAKKLQNIDEDLVKFYE